jgi:hypothetical protein
LQDGAQEKWVRQRFTELPFLPQTCGGSPRLRGDGSEYPGSRDANAANLICTGQIIRRSKTLLGATESFTAAAISKWAGLFRFRICFP